MAVSFSRACGPRADNASHRCRFTDGSGSVRHEEAEFPTPCASTGRLDRAWAVHQAETSVDFSRQSRLMSWFLGGLNFQVEHQLFPRISHVHYPAISRLVEQTCRECGIRYAVHRSLWAGIGSPSVDT
jgi:linoleoyl-CoA desaturase